MRHACSGLQRGSCGGGWEKCACEHCQKNGNVCEDGDRERSRGGWSSGHG